MALTVSRPQHPPRFFESWEAYLASWGGGPENSFCRAVAENHKQILSRLLAKHDEDRARLMEANENGPSEQLEARLKELDAKANAALARAAFPWITPVIGSGCLGVSDGPDALALERVPDQLAEAAAGWGVLPDGSQAAAVVRSFAARLITAKLGGAASPPASGVTSPAETGDQQLASRLTLCASLLSRFYFETCALAEVTLLSPSTSVSLGQEGRPPSSLAAELMENLVWPLEVHLTELVRSLGTPAADDLSFVAAFARQVREDLRLDQPRVRGTDVQLMAELAWHFLATGKAHYPGWSDLLIQLAFAFNSPDREAHRPHLVDLEAARARLAVELKATTRESWAERCATDHADADERPRARQALYDAIADLLVAQAQLNKTTRGTTTAFPPAVAFVTSFDLELEMALLARRQSFRMIVPFYVHRSDGNSGARGLVWLYTDVIPGDQPFRESDLEAIFEPKEWALLVSHSTEALKLHDLPSIVHLAGCPLIGGPDLHKASEAWADLLRTRLGQTSRDSPRKVSVSGTVVLDEHTALQQWAADFGSPGDTKDAGYRLGLPERLVRGMAKDDARFWFLLGVQLHDDAVRQRTAALIGAADLREGLSQTSSESLHLRAGVVINRRSVASQREVFMWQGLDVVETSYQKATGALAHAAQHVLHPERRRVPGALCPIGDPQ